VAESTLALGRFERSISYSRYSPLEQTTLNLLPHIVYRNAQAWVASSSFEGIEMQKEIARFVSATR
jgi:hypothetical protein